MPFNYTGWDENWYSTLCRPWFKNQKNNKSQNTLSDIYTFADSGKFGLTPCAPILKQKEAGNFEDSEFYGALCLDMDPSGPLDEYFPFDEKE